MRKPYDRTCIPYLFARARATEEKGLIREMPYAFPISILLAGLRSITYICVGLFYQQRAHGIFV